MEKTRTATGGREEEERDKPPEVEMEDNYKTTRQSSYYRNSTDPRQKQTNHEEEVLPRTMTQMVHQEGYAILGKENRFYSCTQEYTKGPSVVPKTTVQDKDLLRTIQRDSIYCQWQNETEGVDALIRGKGTYPQVQKRAGKDTLLVNLDHTKLIADTPWLRTEKQKRDNQEVEMKQLLWNLIFGITATYIDTPPTWMKHTKVENSTYHVGDKDPRPLHQPPERLMVALGTLLVVYVIPMFLVVLAKCFLAYCALQVGAKYSPGGKNFKEYIKSDTPLQWTSPQKAIVQYKNQQGIHIPAYTEDKLYFNAFAIESEFWVERDQTVIHITKHRQTSGIRLSDRIAIPRGGSIVLQPTIQKGNALEVTDMHYSTIQNAYTVLMQCETPLWTKNKQHNATFHRLEERIQQHDTYVVRGNIRDRIEERATLMEIILQGRGTTRNEDLGCVREAFNFATGLWTEKEEWLEEAENREEHANEEGQYSLDLLEKMARKYGLQITESIPTAPIGCIQAGWCYDSQEDNFFAHAWAYTLMDTTWFMCDRIGARRLVNRVEEINPPPPYVATEQNYRYRIWQSQHNHSAQPYNLYLSTQEAVINSSLPTTRKEWPVAQRHYSEEEAKQKLVENVLETKYPHGRYKLDLWEGDEKRMAEFSRRIEEVYYLETQDENHQLPLLFKTLSEDPLSHKMEKWVTCIIQGWYKSHFGDCARPSMERVFHILYSNTTQVKLKGTHICKCGRTEKIQSAGGIPDFDDLQLKADEQTWTDQQMWNPYRELKMLRRCHCGSLNNITVYNRAMRSVVMLVPTDKLHLTSYSRQLSWEIQCESTSLIRINLQPTEYKCEVDRTYTMDCLPEDIKSCLSHSEWANLNIAKLQGIHVSATQMGGEKTSIQGHGGLWYTPVMGQKGAPPGKKTLQGGGLLNASIALVAKTKEQQMAMVDYLSKHRPLRLGEETIPEIAQLYEISEEDEQPNMIKRNGEWIVWMYSQWWEETKRGMRRYEGIDPTQLTGIKKMRLQLKKRPTYVAEVYSLWVTQRKNARKPVWMTTKDSTGMIARQTAIRLINALANTDFEIDCAQKGLGCMIPRGGLVRDARTKYGWWLNQQLVLLSTTPKDEVIVTWWEHQTMHCVTMGRNYTEMETEVTNANRIPAEARPVMSILRTQIPPPVEEIIWAGAGYHAHIPRVQCMWRNQTEEDIIKQRPRVSNTSGVDTQVELDNRGLTLPTPLNARRLSAERYSIPLSQIKQIVIQQTTTDHLVTIKTEANMMQSIFKYYTSTPTRWRKLVFLVQQMNVLDKVQGTRKEAQWKIKKAADAAARRAEGLIPFPRMAVKRCDPEPIEVTEPPPSPSTPKTKRTKREVVPNTPKRTPSRKLKYNEDPPYRPGGSKFPSISPEYIVATWNVRSLMKKVGLRHPKLEALTQLIQRDKPDILFLQETWMSPKHWKQYAPTIENIGWWVTVTEDGGPGRGMAILTRRTKGGRPVITKQHRGKLLQVVWRNVTWTNIHVNKGEDPRSTQVPGTIGHVIAGDWNKALHHKHTTLRTTCWPCSAKDLKKRRPYDHIIGEGVHMENFVAIRTGEDGKGYGGSDHAAVVRGATTQETTQRKSFPMWRPNEKCRDIADINLAALENIGSAEKTVRNILLVGKRQMKRLSQRGYDPAGSEEVSNRGLCTEAPWSELQYIVQQQAAQRHPEELREDANTVWKDIKQEQQQRIPLPWPLPQFAQHKEGVARSMNALVGFFHKKAPSTYTPCPAPGEWSGDWETAWRKYSQEKFTVQAMKKYCERHKTSTSGSEGICPQTILLFNNKVQEDIVTWVNNCLQGRQEALQLLKDLAEHDRINLIPKTSTVLEVKHLRPITVSATLLRIVLEQIRCTYGKVMDEVVPRHRRRHQYGFVERQCAKDLSALLQMHWELEQEVHMVSVDIEKAYDNLSRDAVKDMMKMQKWPHTYQNIIEMATREAKAELHYGQVTMKIGPQQRGIKQGAPESPAVFSSVLDMLILPLREKFITKVGEENFSFLLYADDIVITAESAEKVEQMLLELQQQLIKIGLNVNISKTAYIAKTRDRRPLFIQDTVIPLGDSLTHLGIQVASPKIPPKAESKMQKMLTWAMTSGYPRMVITEVVMAKIMGSINYYIAMTTCSKAYRNKIIQQVESLIKETLNMKKTSIDKAVQTGVLPCSVAPKVQMAREILRVWTRMLNSENSMLSTMAMRYLTLTTPPTGCPECLSYHEKETQYKVRESVKWALQQLHCISLTSEACTHNTQKANPTIPWTTTDENVILQVHGKSKALTGEDCGHINRPAWWNQPTKVEWVRSKQPVQITHSRPLLHPILPKAELQYNSDPADVHPIIQLLCSVNGRPGEVFTDSTGGGAVLRRLTLEEGGTYSVYLQTKPAQKYIADLHIMRKNTERPFGEGDWMDPTGATWTIDMTTKEGQKTWKAMVYAVEELEEQHITLGGDRVLQDLSDLERNIDEMYDSTFTFKQAFIPQGDGIWAQGDASNPQDGDTVSGMARMVWRSQDVQATPQIANLHADVPTAEARILLDTIWEARNEAPTTINYITDCEFVCWIDRWAKGKEVNPDKRCLWNIVKDLTWAIKTTQHKIRVWKTLSHICNPGLTIMDSLAKMVVKKKNQVGYKPQGVAAKLQRTNVLLRYTKEGTMHVFSYVGATFKIPVVETCLEDRFHLPKMEGVVVDGRTNQHIAFATKLRLGTLPPHNWETTRNWSTTICPLCGEEEFINHSVVCPEVVSPPLLSYLMLQLRKYCSTSITDSNRYVNKYMEGAVLEQFTRGIILQKGLQTAPKRAWRRIWKKMVPTLFERHMRYWEQRKSMDIRIDTTPYKTYEISEVDDAPSTVEDLYISLRQNRLPRTISHLHQQKSINELQIRNIVQKEACRLSKIAQQ